MRNPRFPHSLPVAPIHPLAARSALVTLVAVATWTMALPAQAVPLLGTAQSFAVLAGTTVTDAHNAPSLPTQIFGDVGTSPGTAITGLFAGVNVQGGTVHSNDAAAQAARTDAAAAYSALSGLAFDTNLTGQVLGAPGLLTLTPGVYHFDSSAQLNGTLVLDFGANPSSNFVFQIGSTLTTASNSFISVLNAGAGSGIYWQIGSSATLGSGTDFAGNLLALSSVTLNDQAQIVCGRAIGLGGAVTLVDNQISTNCTAQPFATVLGDSGSLGFSGGPVTPVPEPATSMLFLAGLAGLAGTRWKRLRPARSLRCIASAAIVSAFAGHAQAATTDWGVHDPLEVASARTPVGSFSDTYRFSLTAVETLFSTAVSNNLTSVLSITGGQVALFQETGVVDAAVGSFAFNNVTGSISHAFGILGLGDYYYQVTGTGAGSLGGFYTLSSTLVPVSPVPEADALAMMLAGLGVIGFLGRRRIH